MKKISTRELKKQAAEGNSQAQFLLAEHYRKKRGRKNFDKAMELYKLSAEQGHIQSNYFLGSYFVYHDTETAIKYLTVAKDDVLDAKYELAECYNILDKYEYEKAFPLYLEAAENGHTEAMEEVAYCYSAGRGGVEKSQETAFQWHLKCANNYNPAGLYALSCYYFDGNVVKEDKEKALRLILASAYLGMGDIVCDDLADTYHYYDNDEDLDNSAEIEFWFARFIKKNGMQKAYEELFKQGHLKQGDLD